MAPKRGRALTHASVSKSQTAISPEADLSGCAHAQALRAPKAHGSRPTASAPTPRNSPTRAMVLHFLFVPLPDTRAPTHRPKRALPRRRPWVWRCLRARARQHRLRRLAISNRELQLCGRELHRAPQVPPRTMTHGVATCQHRGVRARTHIYGCERVRLKGLERQTALLPTCSHTYTHMKMSFSISLKNALPDTPPKSAICEDLGVRVPIYDNSIAGAKCYNCLLICEGRSTL